MFKLITVTLAAIFAVFYFIGAEERRVEVSRQATIDDDTAGFTLAGFKPLDIESTRLPTSSFGMSDGEAISMALEKGAAIRAQRTSRPLYGVIAAVDAAGIKAAAEPAVQIASSQTPMWYVTGSTVNLRQGPGTGNAVVGKLQFGDEAEVLGNDNGWYQIRTADGAVSGWIFGKFLADSRPG